MLKIRRPLGRLIFNMGIAISGKTVFLIETAPCLQFVFITSYCLWHHTVCPINCACGFVMLCFVVVYCEFLCILDIYWRKYYQKITISIFRLVLQNFALPVCLPYIFSIATFSPYFLLVGLLLKELIPRFRSWLWHHRLPNVTTTEAQPRLWWHLGVCGVTAMTENEVSISILSWYHKINFKLVDVVKPNCFSAAQV